MILNSSYGVCGVLLALPVSVDLRWIFWFSLSLEKFSQLIQLLVIRYISTTGCCMTTLEKCLIFLCNGALEYHPLYRGVCKTSFLIPLLPASRICLLCLLLLTFKVQKSFSKIIAQWQSKFCCDQCCVKEHFRSHSLHITIQSQQASLESDQRRMRLFQTL